MLHYVNSDFENVPYISLFSLVFFLNQIYMNVVLNYLFIIIIIIINLNIHRFT